MQLTEAKAAFEHWLSHHNDLSPHSVRAYTSDVAAFERCLGETLSVTTITEAHLRVFLEFMVASGLSSASMRRRFVGVRIFSSWLVEAGHLEADPSKGVAVHFAKPRRLPRAISQDDVRRLLLHLCAAAQIESDGSTVPLSSPRFRSMSMITLVAVALMIGTGMRGCELVALRVADVDLPNRSMRLLGKGRRERVVYLSNEWICQMLAALIADRGQDAGGSPVFLNRTGQPLTTTALRARVKQAAHDAGLNVTVTPHMLRKLATAHCSKTSKVGRENPRLSSACSLRVVNCWCKF